MITAALILLPQPITSCIDGPTLVSDFRGQPTTSSVSSARCSSGMPEAIYTAYKEELASWGYIVVGIDHTDGSSFVEFLMRILSLGYLQLPPILRLPFVRAQNGLFIAQQVTSRNIASWLTGFQCQLVCSDSICVEHSIYKA